MKESLRQACLKRMRGQRADIVARARARNSTAVGDENRLDIKMLVNSVISEECVDGISETDMMILMHEMEEDLMKEEALLMQEVLSFEENHILEQQRLSEQIQTYEQDQIANTASQEYQEQTQHGDKEEVICPICCKHNLIRTNANVILCPGGSCLRLDVGAEGMTLYHVRELLNRAYKDHSSVCTGGLTFQLVNEFGVCTLRARCIICQADVIVL